MVCPVGRRPWGMPPVASTPSRRETARKGQALSPSLLRGLPEGRLSQDEFPSGWRFTVIAVDRRFFDDGVGLQVGRVLQLGLADAVVAQAFHEATDFRRGSRGAMGSPPRRGGAGRLGMISASRRARRRPSACSRIFACTPA